MKFNRSSGILLHPTSLPGPDGIGDLGPEVFRWINFLADTGCALWQVLPLGPTGYGDSPYQCFSAFAGNPYLINPFLLQEDQLLKQEDLANRPAFSEDRVDFGQAILWKLKLLDTASSNFAANASKELRNAYRQFQSENEDWLPDFTLFMSIKEIYGGVSWDKWPLDLRKRNPKALSAFLKDHAESIERHSLRQFFFFRQWEAVRAYAKEKNILIIGDIPIFVAYDSADAWANPDLFYMDDKGLPTVVAGVPPDYFSPTGQLWGNPLYRWDYHDKTGYEWWLKRIKATLKTVDIIRLDHFRGFAGYWEVPFGMPTAEIGRWVPGPGKKFFQKVRDELGELPIIAEDLGEITPDVIELRESFGLPGMRILQFAFASDSNDPFLPHNYVENCVSYTGTHDNDTVIGWYQSGTEKEKDFYRRYMARSGEDVAWDLVRGVWSSVSMFALAPLQDILRLGNDARMNFPGKPSGNWTWRARPGYQTHAVSKAIKEINMLYSRNNLLEN
jgi:4-alpha-glucanotransferase